MAKENKKVLVVDLDSQANTTRILKVDEVAIEKNLVDLFEVVRLDTDFPDTSKFIYTSLDGVDFIRNNNLLGNIEIALATEMFRETILRRILEPIKAECDFIILDLECQHKPVQNSAFLFLI